MKPSQVFIFFVSVFLVLFAVTLYFPDDGLQIGRNFTLKFFTASDVFGDDTVKYADIEHIIRQEIIIDEDEDSTVIKALVTDTVRANADSLKKNLVKIEYPSGQERLLYPFFRSLKYSNDSGTLVRIMHYGDSQIEGDRITSFLRNRLQGLFGGYGPGLMPSSQIYDFSYAIIQKSSPNWAQFTLFGERDTTVKHKRYGALASFCTITQDQKSDTGNYEAWVSFKQSPYSYKNTRKFSRCRVFYGNSKEPFLNQIYINNTLFDADILPPVDAVQEIKWTFQNPQSDILLKFKGKTSPEIYGISLESRSGVIVDNVPMRGCSGSIFTSINFNQLKSMYNMLGVKLIMLQYGGNVVPHIVDDYSYYENIFYNQIKYLKKACPEAVILVIGLADMSVKEKNHYVTYPNLEKVREAIKTASFRGGAAYWDMYEAMGGRNSMPSWVFADPPLASKDFVHFNPKGALIIAQMLYNAIMFEYNDFNKHENLQQ